MAANTITIEKLTANTISTDLVAGANMTSNAASDTFTLTPLARTEDLIIAIKGSGSYTVTFNAGVYPIATRKGIGTVVVTGANTEVRLVMLDSSRLTQTAGTITGTVTGATCLIGAFRIPRTV